MSKLATYQKIKCQLDEFLVSYSPKLDKIALMSTLNSLLKSNFSSLIFVGFYLMKSINGEQTLEIGPYQGDVLACARISLGDGVCGKAAQQKQILIVSNVKEFDGYIACDSQTSSEIVIPVYEGQEVTAVFDLDHGDIGYFDDTDAEWLGKLLEYL